MGLNQNYAFVSTTLLQSKLLLNKKIEYGVNLCRNAAPIMKEPFPRFYQDFKVISQS